ncbi:uncharacterized protein [Lepeophtheirus salmonis]|uniref:uncharacterized protein n=1 Tax=Lepeophtheirus salmonis TaxID=72036 RepID=UPI001AE74489|nr:uncharacterized protein LOC121125242 [Lepeophtheirus salmonis]
MQENTESVVSTVKSLLSLTKSERSRRGKYYKYDPEIRDAIAEFALAHGATEASKHFTDKLDLKISSSTIRNFIKSYQAYTPQVKEEIGKYALDHGPEKCFEHFKSRFNPNETGEESSFTMSLVNRFKKYYESKTTAAKNDDGTTRIFVVDIPVSSSSSSSISLTEGPTKNFFNSKLKNDIGQYAYHCGNKKTVEHFSNRLQVPMKESTVRKFKKRWMEFNNISLPESVPNKVPKSNISLPKEEKLSNGVSLPEKDAQESRIEEEVDEEDEHEDENSEDDEVNEEKNKNRLYSSYDPELRAKIAKYAIHHNNKETAEYFKVVHNKILPRSTIRFLRDKFKSMDDDNEDMTQLDFGPRGRPTRLGCYDSILQKCIIDLAKSGEKLTSFLVIATAKQVLLKYEPSLLKENGGNISLDPNWAKSILRRVQKSLRKGS